MGRRGRRRPCDTQLHGVLVLHKPEGPTSAACLERIKRVCGQPRIGHAGTLDPLATGVLVVLLGQATKLSNYLTGADKTYVGELELGKTTDTYDIQGAVVAEADWSAITSEDVAAAVAAWKDDTVQEVPAYSAAKHQGQPLYKLAREGLEAPVKLKVITIFEADAVSVDLPRCIFRVRCSAGAYVRSLVHSLGIRMGCGAVMTALTRSESHPFTLDMAVSLDEILAEPERLGERIIPLEDALPHWPRATLDAERAEDLKRSGRLPWESETLDEPSFAPGRRALFLDQHGKALGLMETGFEKTGGAAVWTVLRGLWESEAVQPCSTQSAHDAQGG